MKVLFDHQTFIYQNYGGISRYFIEVISALKQKYPADIDLPLLYSHNEHLIEKQMNPTKPILKKIKGGWRIQHLMARYNRVVIKKRLAKGVDVFHPTYFDTYYLNSLGKARFLLTIYDMIHEKRLVVTDNTKANLEVVTNKKILVERADKIIAISESTKKDIIEIYGTDPDKIEVIYLSSSLQPVKEYSPSIKIPEKYILFVGNRRSYKNFELFFQSVSSLLKEDKDLHIICAGGKKFSEAEIANIESFDLQSRVLQMNFDDKLLAWLYQNAICFVFPSLYEGFGIPTLEAFACGCPVVLSNTSSMPEVGGDAAMYIDPSSRESIYNTVKKIIESPSLQQEMRTKGYEQLKKFSWQKCADEHYHLYKKIIK
ncbi:glycosyltransferase family 4 protein [Ferruginibacter sp. SUN002]|uniref:glycosyltransferase family 4 protein n=1 Tax=Ferruginibacter sp. SUN002 TaxID=2937789 RepID=UPI003D35F2BD